MDIRREKYLQVLHRNKHNHLVKIITGLRRVGKSHLLFNQFKYDLLMSGVPENHIISMSFDNFAYREYRKPEKLYDFVKEQVTDKEMYYVLLDEVQLLKDFVDVLNGFLYMENVDVYVTGSNARFLSKDVVTEFRGRGVQIHVAPLTFKEYRNAFHEKDILDCWKEFTRYGSLPMVVLAEGEEQKTQVLSDLVRETYLTDIIERNRIQHDEELNEILLFMASSVGSLINIQKIVNTIASEKHIRLTHPTCHRYVKAFVDAFLFEQAMRYDVRGRKYINNTSKYYLADCGLCNVLVNFRQEDLSHLMENIIYNELRYRGYHVDVGSVDSFGQDENGKTIRKTLEVDFICNQADQRYYIQSALEIPSREKYDQELASLRSIRDSFKKIMIVGATQPTYKNEDGILILNIFDFLMKDNALEM